MLLPLETVGLVLHSPRFSQVYARGQDRSTRPWALPALVLCMLPAARVTWQGQHLLPLQELFNVSVCAWRIGHLPLHGQTLGPSSGAPHALCWPRLQGDSVLFPASLHPAALPGGGSISKPQGAGGSSARAGLVQRWRGRSHVRILGAAN